METDHGRVDTEWLDACRDGPEDAESPAHGHAHAHRPSEEPHAHGEESVALLDGAARRMETSGLGRHACGWIFDPDIRFSHPRLTALLQGAQEDDHRIKGILHTDNGWWLYNAVGAEATWREVTPSDDSRIEYISATEPRDWTAFEEQLLRCRI